VAEQVVTTPGAEAARSREERVSYRELWARSERIARTLVALGAGSGATVGVHLPRSVDLVCALVGTLRAGSACVPLDVTFPADRLRYMRATAGVVVVVGHQDLAAGFADMSQITRDGGLVFAATGTAPRGGGGTVDELPTVSDDDLAYLVYTSGSTGRPKGVRYEHRNLANLIAWQIASSRCGPGDRTLQFAPASFDVTFQEILTTLGEGGAVVCCTDDERLDPELLWELIARERLNRLFAPFVTIQSLAVFAGGVSPQTHPLREIVTSGEQVQANTSIRAMFQALPDCRLVNQWGTTETHVATAYTLPADAAMWPDLPPIGTPIDCTRVVVRREDSTPVATGETGELWIAGDCVGPGYLNLPELTAERYVPDPDNASVRAFRTGDLGRLRADGLLEFLGRRDTQVKVRGFRVELGEIETVLGSFPGVAEAAVVVAGRAAEDRYLYAFVVPKGEPVDPRQMSASLRETLPEYMVPARIQVVPALPRTPNGKVDRLSLGTWARS
jgi:amino acid adenylation domain-containing protein